MFDQLDVSLIPTTAIDLQAMQINSDLFQGLRYVGGG